MDSLLSQQLRFLLNENQGCKLEAILQKIFESEIYFFADILQNPNVVEVFQLY